MKDNLIGYKHRLEYDTMLSEMRYQANAAYHEVFDDDDEYISLRYLREKLERTKDNAEDVLRFLDLLEEQNDKDRIQSE